MIINSRAVRFIVSWCRRENYKTSVHVQTRLSGRPISIRIPEKSIDPVVNPVKKIMTPSQICQKKL